MGIALCKNGHLIHAGGFAKAGKCKACQNMWRRNWVDANPERAKELMARWRKKNPERMKELVVRWVKENPDKVKVYKSKWAKENPDKCRAGSLKYYKANKSKCDEASKKWAEANPERRKAIYLRYAKTQVGKAGDSYICNYLLGLPLSEVPQEIIELKRLHLLLKREIKKWKQSTR